MAGKPEHEPTAESRKTVEAMIAYGVPQDDVAKVIGVDPKTLRKHYREQIDTAVAKANAKVAESLFKQATKQEDASVPAMIFWLKVRAGWSEKSIVELVGRMSDEELEAEAARILARKSSSG